MTASAPVAFTHVETLLGRLLLTAREGRLTGIYFTDQAHAPQPQPGWVEDESHPVLLAAAREIKEYLAGARTRFTVPLGLAGTAFQQSVWQAIAAIPHGETVTYAEIARRIGSPRAVRAVGAAAGRNPVCLIVPCHRVVGRDGQLTGYAGGLARKQSLLARERPAPQALAA